MVSQSAEYPAACVGVPPTSFSGIGRESAICLTRSWNLQKSLAMEGRHQGLICREGQDGGLWSGFFIRSWLLLLGRGSLGVHVIPKNRVMNLEDC